MMGQLCVFVCSSDNTYDVFEATRERLIESWPLSEVPGYVGINTLPVPAPLQAARAPASGWRTELLHQLATLPANVQHITLLLDDFYFDHAMPVERLRHLSEFLQANQGDYLRLRPVERAFVPWVVRRARKALGLLPDIERLKPSEPYYSSLQVAIWRRAYLTERLNKPGNIWEFEHEAPAGSRHFAVTSPCLSYDHLVEKGKWYRSAPERLQLPASSPVFRRGFESDPFKNAKLYNRIKFLLLGYSVFRVRRFLSSRFKS